MTFVHTGIRCPHHNCREIGQSRFSPSHDKYECAYRSGVNFTRPSLTASSAGLRGYLILRNDGQAKLIYDNRIPKPVEEAHVEDRRVVTWYDGQHPATGPRQLAPLEAVNPSGSGLRVHDRPGDPYAETLIRTLTAMRRRKGPDEIDLLRRRQRPHE